MAGKLNLDPTEIVNKQFAIDFRGYAPAQVDQMLDQVIQDYQTYEEMMASLNKKIKDLEQTNASLRAKLIQMEGTMRAKSENDKDTQDPMMQGAAQVDLLRRLSRLEKAVFGSDKNRQ
ncbi:MAG: DivIVA domain-containing protein [Solobacterium sp.]|nr:DivIVA domain-containing protein [Solobacterium sp.]